MYAWHDHGRVYSSPCRINLTMLSWFVNEARYQASPIKPSWILLEKNYIIEFYTLYMRMARPWSSIQFTVTEGSWKNQMNDLQMTKALPDVIGYNFAWSGGNEADINTSIQSQWHLRGYFDPEPRHTQTAVCPVWSCGTEVGTSIQSRWLVVLEQQFWGRYTVETTTLEVWSNQWQWPFSPRLRRQRK